MHTGMRDSIEFAGRLTPKIRELFVELEPSLVSFDQEQKLWDYALLHNGKVILSIGDYHDLQIEGAS
jgi:hypothetical protein